MATVRRIATTFIIGWMVLAAGVASGQEYPAKPIRVITSDIGSGSDVSARIVAQGVASALGQPMVVENRPGAIVPDLVAKSPADGYTLMFSGPIWILPLLRKDITYDTLRDFVPVTWVTSSPAILVVHPSLPVKTVKELIALARSMPGKLNYASAPSGSTNHLAAELFKSMASVDIARIPYKGSGAAMNDLLSGQVHMTFAVSSPAPAHIKVGRLRGLAVSGAQRSALLPELPTIAEAGGLRGYEAVAMSGMFAPAKTPAAILNRLHQETLRVISQPETRQRYLNNGSDVIAGTSEQFTAAIKTDVARWAKLVKDAGIRDVQ
jgi:tripartite-type tricarboxylate transporter receptor subunit TctC